MAGRVRDHCGGIFGLRDLILAHGEALENDLLRAGLRLDWLGTAALTWRDLRIFVKFSPKDSALHRMVHPPTMDEQWELIPQLLAGMFDMQAVGNYLLQRLGGNDRATYPDPLPRPGVKASTPDKFVGKPVPMDEMDALLGWNQN
ncbi:hypothetical protein [Arthrobacter sp. HY1533]|uniref:hypothetical protein n=1 Tax=Arthrobacter sp. HY1533 TaxID=2970919 RepID=UPI0022B9F7EC|nr:hypothetical protein [Arthrobacter sp. HY1533]